MPTAKEYWEKLDKQRDGVMTRGRDCADLTIPALMPPLGSNENTRLPTPYQSLGARGVNNLASKLTLALLPTGHPFFRFQIGDEAVENIASGKSEIEEGLRQLEVVTSKGIENSNLRPIMNIAMKLLVTTGNALLHIPDSGNSRVYNLTQYVCVRDPMGTVLKGVIKEDVHPSTLDDETRETCQVVKAADDDESVAVYTMIQRKDNKIEYWQEINEIEVPGSRGRNKAAESPFIFLRWNSIDGEDYGRGHCEEYLGDLRSLEGLSKSIVTFAAAAAKVIFLEHPNAVTNSDDLRDAESGEFVTGRREDIDVLQLEKYADFQIAKSTLDDLSLRLSHGFLLTSGTVRDAERVTAEEIRLQAQELEDVLGGVYTVFTQELQIPLANRLIARARKAGKFPNLPEGAIEPQIITGFDALGRGHELNRYRQYFTDGVSLFGPEFMGQFNLQRAAQLLATQHNVDIADLKKTDEEIQGEQQQAMMATALDKGTGPVAGVAAQAAADQLS